MPGAAKPFHICPLVNSSTGNPHTSPEGMITPGMQSKVMIEGQIALVANDVCVCLGPEGGPSSILSGSTKVKFGGLAAARMGDPGTHSGAMISQGSSKVIIGG